jgi:hypothetical protein
MSSSMRDPLGTFTQLGLTEVFLVQLQQAVLLGFSSCNKLFYEGWKLRFDFRQKSECDEVVEKQI